MQPKSFGSFFKELRMKNGQTLRKFCQAHDFDPGNISKIERGRMMPPVDQQILNRYAAALNLQSNSDDWNEFIILAGVESKRIPEPIVENEDFYKRLPLLFRTITGQKLSPEKLDLLIEMMKKE